MVALVPDTAETVLPVTPQELADTAENRVPVKAAAVELHDNIAVTAETYAAGAAALHEEEAEEIEVLPRSKPTFLVAAAILAVATTGLAMGARSFTHAKATAKVAAAPKVAPAAQPKVQPAVEVSVEEDELPALPVSAPKRGAGLRGSKRASPSRLEGKYNPRDEPAAPADDFSLSNGGGEDGQREDLKRPSF
jgi:hypothetical protein